MTLPPPPAELEALAACLGAEGLFKLIRHCGGLRIYVPGNPRQGQELVDLLGLPLVEALARQWGFDYLKVPLARAWFARCLLAQGMTQRGIALEMRTTENTVRLLLRGGTPPDAQRDTRQIGLPL